MQGPLTQAQIDQFSQDGYLVIRRLLDEQETALTLKAARQDEAIRVNAMSVIDTKGRVTNLSLWNHPGDDIYGAICRSRRVVDSMEQLLGDEVYHYHSKLSAKEPKVGGAWEWHQDYGYWYQNGCLFPDLASVFIALDPATRENGCLQLLRGSHRMGRVEHGRFGSQTGADPERVEAAMQRMERVYCEMAPGDAVFFHGNTLHSSDANLSDKPRWGLICCYNTRNNNPYKDSHHPSYTPLIKLDNTAIKAMGAQGSETNKSFLEAKRDRTQGATQE
ncbi:MAG: phytanoyl-CoA dioxygenase family protein [Planctomycetota bacterium]|nr:phytanoyl-CoA dioxygenase family protein [Planctomycetota bacterium]